MRDISIVAIVYSFYGLTLNVIVVLSLENRIICATRNMNVFVGHQRFLFACCSSLCKSQAKCVLFLTAHVCVCKYHADVSTICMRHLNQDFIEDSFPKNEAYRTCILRKLPIKSILY